MTGWTGGSGGGMGLDNPNGVPSHVGGGGGCNSSKAGGDACNGLVDDDSDPSAANSLWWLANKVNWCWTQSYALLICGAGGGGGGVTLRGSQSLTWGGGFAFDIAMDVNQRPAACPVTPAGDADPGNAANECRVECEGQAYLTCYCPCFKWALIAQGHSWAMNMCQSE